MDTIQLNSVFEFIEDTCEVSLNSLQRYIIEKTIEFEDGKPKRSSAPLGASRRSVVSYDMESNDTLSQRIAYGSYDKVQPRSIKLTKEDDKYFCDITDDLFKIMEYNYKPYLYSSTMHIYNIRISGMEIGNVILNNDDVIIDINILSIDDMPDLFIRDPVEYLRGYIGVQLRKEN